VVVIDPALAAFLEGGCAQNVATSDGDGDPTIGRAWGLRVSNDRVVRAIIGADTATSANLGFACRIAVLLIDVSSYRSVQIKGSVVGIESPSLDDEDVYDVYRQEFTAALVAEDRTTPLDDALPASIVAVTIDVDSVFDQTPGPDAGRSIAGRS
jgi:hypothetical protein